MKTIYFITSIILAFHLRIAFATNTIDDKLPNFHMDDELSAEEIENLKELVNREFKLQDLSKVQTPSEDVTLNDFIDKLLANVRRLIVDDGLDCTSLPDFAVNIGIGETKLTEGQLNDTSTIERRGNTVLSYNSDMKRLSLKMTLGFQDLKFIFKYYTKVTLFSITGNLHGAIKDIHINVQIGFDFNTELVYVDYIDFQNTGCVLLI
ncbi:unnamed protein product [Ceutorhynchus assimilis]|uniref:Uncharacterized protein n=1 Tax=Ceutorhynchus assimilis TaxID=467358 RepID=A0A9N9MQX1_9CUCU|nr:unnamed protein product [Ceutorhynchus assimilis]